MACSLMSCAFECCCCSMGLGCGWPLEAPSMGNSEGGLDERPALGGEASCRRSKNVAAAAAALPSAARCCHAWTQRRNSSW